MKTAIVGTGLIGGSLALALKKTGFASNIIGVDKNPDNLQKAMSLGIIDSQATLPEACQMADLIVLAIPVDAIYYILVEVLDKIHERTIVVDMGSTKSKICQLVKDHPKRQNFVASHPIAGTENAGPEAALVNLFQGKKAIICEEQRSSKPALELAISMYKTLEMNIEIMEPEIHDLHIAYVSHLSHISAFSLGLTALDMAVKEKDMFKMAGGGFSSTVRLAKSSPEMWGPIFEQNNENISAALGEYIDHLIAFKKAIDEGNTTRTKELMEKAAIIRSKI
ncbi:prephenate dehydrogenase [Marivirga sp. S37H4]|uniref:Prephenate dehydrogenase n=1 Tax=Marivirga aurantiaca TaxID=2802615 RepID=A0A934WYY2_9BACT|nr:prephenate dehydrogenase [Marivirga aurantiaca]MBK6265476.1 prephenate dehydrogenase [Marivirga aurantiaca]